MEDHPSASHGAGEGDLPAAHAHAVVTKLMLLVECRPDRVDFGDLFEETATFEDPIGRAVGRDAIRTAFELRAHSFKPAIPDHPPHEGGRARGESTLHLSVQPQTERSCRVELVKRYSLRGEPPDEFQLASTLFVELGASGRVARLEDKWDETLVAW